MHLLGVMKMIDDLSMAHDNLQRELADIKQRLGKDKHELIKSNIALNKRVQGLERDVRYLRERENKIIEINQHRMKYLAEVESRNIVLEQQNKHYRELLKKIKEMTRYDDCREAEIYELVSDELEGEE